MEREFQQLITSNSPEERAKAVSAISERIASLQFPSSSDVNGLSALLVVVYDHDQSAHVRCAAVHSSFFPCHAIARTLFDSDPDVRFASLQKIGVKTSGRGLLSYVLALLAVESEENILLEALGVLKRLLEDQKEDITPNQILAMLGHQEASDQSIGNVMDRLESFGVIRDVVEHDSPQVRSTALRVLAALVMRTHSMAEQDSMPLNFKATVFASRFVIMEELLQDTVPAVQMKAVHGLIGSRILATKECRTMNPRLSEKSAKCLLQLVEPQIQGDVSCPESAMLIFATLKFYPLATLSAYGLVETFLRRRLYLARTTQIQNRCADKGNNDEYAGDTAIDASELVRILEMSLRDLVKENTDFARILDLTRPQSDKYGHLVGVNV